MIIVKHLTKIYGKNDSRFVALQDVSFSVPDKSTVSIIGKSGSGKSTLMHIMSGLDAPTSGLVEIDGTNLYDMKRKTMDTFRATKMSFIFQSFFIEANQTCYQNVMLPLEIAKVSKRKRRALVIAALRSVDLDEKATVLAAKLSGGQKQRLAIARAIVNKPSILFADEPTGNLDSATGHKIMQLLFALNEKLGCTLVLVTHDVDLAKRCQKQIVISDGKLLLAAVRSPKPKVRVI